MIRAENEPRTDAENTETAENMALNYFARHKARRATA